MTNNLRMSRTTVALLGLWVTFTAVYFTVFGGSSITPKVEGVTAFESKADVFATYVDVLRWYIDSHLNHIQMYTGITFALMAGARFAREEVDRVPRKFRLSFIAGHAWLCLGTIANLHNDFTLHNSVLASGATRFPELAIMFARVPIEIAIPCHALAATVLAAALAWLVLHPVPAQADQNQERGR